MLGSYSASAVVVSVRRIVTVVGVRPIIVAVALLGGPMAHGADNPPLTYADGTPSLGARYDATGTQIVFRVYSAHARRIDLYLYANPLNEAEKLRVSLTPDATSSVWSKTVAVADVQAKGIADVVFYGYRAWGPNWTFDPAWVPGSSAGFALDVDKDGNRFNPNKLLIDPYAAELSHDPETPNGTHDGSVYASGPLHRLFDTGAVAPKGIVLKPDRTDYGAKPARPFRDEIIYEVHLRGLTKLDPNIAATEQGTYRGAARKVDYLKTLGITAVEFLPIHELDNDDNDIAPANANYWGYDTLDYFAPDRRYSSDKLPGGPTREFKQMVKAFHDAGIKVYLDVVFNHTWEENLYGGNQTDTANLISWRGLDNSTYYELQNGNQTYCNNNGVGANFNCAGKVVRDEILDSLTYWSKVMGVDGFRFDLAPILGNTLGHQRGDSLELLFDKLPGDNPLNRAVKELPVRPPGGGSGVDLIAEPWGEGGNGNSQQQGNFPSGWAEWNDAFRNTLRASQNKLGFENVTPGQLAIRFAGSSDRFQNNGRKPWHSVNQIVAHDGFCLHDLYRFSSNDDRRAWDQGGDPSLQRQATRNGFAFPIVSAGVPMFTGGDEFGRTQNNNDNSYNIDNSTNYLNWSLLNDPQSQALNRFARLAIAFRRAHPALRPAEFFQGADHNGNGLKDVTWYRDDGQEADPGYMTANDRHFLAYRVDGTEFGDPAVSVYVGYNSWLDTVNITLPKPLAGKAWWRAADTASWMEPQGNFKDPGKEDALNAPGYGMQRRSLLVLIER